MRGEREEMRGRDDREDRREEKRANRIKMKIVKSKK